MPSRNVLKIDIPDSYYHVYARGGSRQPVFLEDVDYQYFLLLFGRYLGEQEIHDKAGMAYKKLTGSIELLAYCLMKNHFHLLIYQHEPGAMQRLMRGVMTAYSSYFNKKYQRSGSLFESRYKASRITNDSYLLHISRYIHLNPDKWRHYLFSSIAAYRDNTSPDWLTTDRILSLFPSAEAYYQFVGNYKDIRDELEQIKHELAGY